MKLSKSELEGQSILVIGLRGTGKTYFVKEIVEKFDSTMVYTPHQEEWSTTNKLVWEPDDFVSGFEGFLRILRDVYMPKVDSLVVDEADLLWGRWEDVSETLRDVNINQRHYDLTVFWVSRRPQDLPTKVYNIVENYAVFKIEAPPIIDRLNKIHKDFGKKVKQLPFGEHKFIWKRTGEKPVEAKI